MESAPLRIQRLHSTKNDLPEKSRRQLVALLNQRLADSIDLQTQTKTAHWNVKGPSFIALHKLFDEINEEVEELRGSAGRAGRAARAASPRGRCGRAAERRSSTSIRSTSRRTGSTSRRCRRPWRPTASASARAIGEADDLDDADTADLFTEISRGIDKWLWFVEAHLGDGAAPTRRRKKLSSLGALERRRGPTCRALRRLRSRSGETRGAPRAGEGFDRTSS